MHGPLFEQIWIPFTQEYFVSCLVEIGSAVLKKIFKSFQYFSIFDLPLENGQGPSFERNRIPLTQGWSVSRLVEIGLVVLENKSSMYFHSVAIIALWQS